MAGQHPDLARLAAAERSRAADTVAHLADPMALVPLVLLVVALQATTSVLVGLGWALLASLFCAVVPYAVLQALLRRGHVTDRHVVVREQRRKPLLGALVSVLLGVGALIALRAPAPITALVVAMLAGLALMTLVSLAYKASFHAAVLSGVSAVVALNVGPVWALPLVPLLVLVGWARIRAGRHTLAQVLVGTLLGAAAALAVYPALA